MQYRKVLRPDISKTLRVTNSLDPLAPGNGVLYRNPMERATSEGEGQLCHVISVVYDGKQRHCRVDVNARTPFIPAFMNIKHAVALPSTASSTMLPHLDKGRNSLLCILVLATFTNQRFWRAGRQAMMRKGRQTSFD